MYNVMYDFWSMLLLLYKYIIKTLDYVATKVLK